MDDLISRKLAIDEVQYEIEMINHALDSLTLDYNTRERLLQRKVEAREILDSIETLPTVDAVLIVRCKDCRFATWYTAADGVKRCFCDNHGSAGHIETDFCSYAEREEEDGNG